MNDRLEAIEIKIAYLEHANAELSDVVYRQRQELEALQARVDALADRLEGTQAPASPYTLEEEKPPHY
jgi:SlyX protein